MRIAVTGAAGFIGRAVVRRLAAQWHTVVALVRDPERARGSVPAGVDVARSDLSDQAALTDLLRGADGVIHLAGAYRVGIRPDERPSMEDANVGATERVLDAAIAANVGRIVHVSTANTYGDTVGAIVDETYERDVRAGFLSWYDETKFRAQRAAEARIAAGAPIVVVQPGIVYGPGDHSAVGRQLAQAFAGRLPYVAFGQAGVTPVHVDDIAAGIVAALERGRVGERYILAGIPMRLDEAIRIAAEAGGKAPPRLRMPTGVLRSLAALPLGWVPASVRRASGLPYDLREVVSAGDVTYWVSSDKARRELGFDPRPLAAGAVDAFGTAAASAAP